MVYNTRFSEHHWRSVEMRGLVQASSQCVDRGMSGLLWLEAIAITLVEWNL